VEVAAADTDTMEAVEVDASNETVEEAEAEDAVAGIAISPTTIVLVDLHEVVVGIDLEGGRTIKTPKPSWSVKCTRS
jgi:hypothetical protein